MDGPPEAGKSTIAATLALMHATEGFEIIDLRDPSQFFKIYDNKHQQLFIADDAVGEVEYNPALTENWSKSLHGILRVIDKDHLLIWTSRKYILEEAVFSSKLDGAIKDFPGINEVLVEVDKLSNSEKAGILYNHAKLANLSDEVKKIICSHARQIINNQNFTPERIRQLIGEIKKNGKEIKWKEIEDFLNNPGKNWIIAYKKLSESQRILLISMLDFNGRGLVSNLKKTYEIRCAQLKFSRTDFMENLHQLEHSFLQLSLTYDRQQYVNFQHPSLKDMIIGEIRNDSIARNNYIISASPNGCANIINGIGLFLKDQTKSVHAIIPIDSREVNNLIERLSYLLSNSMNSNELNDILSSLDLLLSNLSKEKGVKSSYNSSIEKIIDIIIFTFSKKNIYEINKDYNLSEWTFLLEKYFNLSKFYFSLPPPNFLSNIATILINEEPKDNISFFNILYKNNIQLVIKNLSTDLLSKLNDYILTNLYRLIKIRDSIPDSACSEDYYEFFENEYDDWYENSTRIINLGKIFYEWAPFELPKEIKILEESINQIEKQSSEKGEDFAYDEWKEDEESDYWTIEEMFKDL